eukprot:CAMPEP_0197674678 /NCGR_PEP_ID=MMETSP1338-20131121/83454_1 /TAXON_ID=43686 ORGANISM="Pelagodinium beii, Strain RCC1491" /NCGR_SAMPLE_ID=MMETSP1338 /ASSEMBLY_ACC=CAM_ASM_000754 /LENGTH=105 /DNA_ID=CAMNT_0043255123 /DNA_START=442 /DNA_END=759 /DNA_ORIENTATION=-
MGHAQATEHAGTAGHELLHGAMSTSCKGTANSSRGDTCDVHVRVLLGEIEEVHVADNLSILVIAHLPPDWTATAWAIVILGDGPLDIILLKVSAVIRQQSCESQD